MAEEAKNPPTSILGTLGGELDAALTTLESVLGEASHAVAGIRDTLPQIAALGEVVAELEAAMSNAYRHLSVPLGGSDTTPSPAILRAVPPSEPKPEPIESATTPPEAERAQPEAPITSPEAAPVSEPAPEASLASAEADPEPTPEASVASAEPALSAEADPEAAPQAPLAAPEPALSAAADPEAAPQAPLAAPEPAPSVEADPEPTPEASLASPEATPSPEAEPEPAPEPIQLVPETEQPVASPAEAAPGSPASDSLQLSITATSGSLDLKAVDRSINESPAVVDVTLLDYDGRNATLKVWITETADPAGVREALLESLLRNFGDGQDTEISIDLAGEQA